MEFWKMVYDMGVINIDFLREAVITNTNKFGDITADQFKEITGEDFIKATTQDLIK